MTSGKRKPKPSKPARDGKVLARLDAAESASILSSLLARHPELVSEAEELARTIVTDVDAEGIAEDIEQAVRVLDYEDLNQRAGSHSWGYVDPTEAAWELMEEVVDPYLDEMRRHIELGFEAAAKATCAGIVLGLYRCREKESRGDVLGWAEDFPAETAGRAVATLARESGAKHGRAWRLSDAVLDEVSEWKDDRPRVETGSRAGWISTRYVGETPTIS